MSRYIDATALHDALKAKQKWVVRCGDKHNEGYTYDQVHFAIDEAPSISLVRCEECKYKEKCEQIVVFDIWENQLEGRRIDFCSYGERRDDD